MANCIFTACYNYRPHLLVGFVKSCRRVFAGEIVAVIGGLPQAAVAMLKKYDVRIFSFEKYARRGKFVRATVRYKLFKNIIETEKLLFEKALLCDSRDIIFQSDPFAFDQRDYHLKVFLEDELIGNCVHTSGWIKLAYGAETLNLLSDRQISCSGTTMGSYSGIVEYLEKMTFEFESLSDRQGKLGVDISYDRRFQGIDQGFHNHLVYTNAFPRSELIENAAGEVQTMNYQKEFLFNRSGQILNTDKRLCPIVHQYDRHREFVHAVMRANGVVQTSVAIDARTLASPRHFLRLLGRLVRNRRELYTPANTDVED